MNKPLSLSIPLNPNLDNIDISEVAGVLEDCGSRVSVESLNWPDKFPYRPLTVVSAAHSGTTLYLDFLVRCNYLRAEHYTDNDLVCEDSSVEFYLSPDPRHPDEYISLGVNCIGTMRGTRYSSDGSCRQIEPAVLKRVRRMASVGTRPFCEVEGSFIWSVVLAIPLDVLGISYEGKPHEFRGNFNKCATCTSQPHYMSWAPISAETPDFHHPEAFAPIILE